MYWTKWFRTSLQSGSALFLDSADAHPHFTGERCRTSLIIRFLIG
jgi:hypothetical protein